jgi:copper chaperone CopZ
MKSKTIEVKGMSCGHCVQSVTQALAGIDGLKDVKVDLAFGLASFMEEKPIDESVIKQAIERIGFTPGAVK